MIKIIAFYFIPYFDKVSLLNEIKLKKSYVFKKVP